MNIEQCGGDNDGVDNRARAFFFVMWPLARCPVAMCTALIDWYRRSAGRTTPSMKSR